MSAPGTYRFILVFMEGDEDESVRISSLVSSTVNDLSMKNCDRLSNAGVEMLAEAKFAIQLCLLQSKMFARVR